LGASENRNILRTTLVSKFEEEYKLQMGFSSNDILKTQNTDHERREQKLDSTKHFHD
jgi:hypothetical protein